MRRSRPLVALLMIPLVLAMSGCFSLQAFKWSAKFIRPGKSIKAILTLGPVDKAKRTDHVFVLVGLPEFDPGETQYHIGQRRIWDANGTFNGPKEMISDPTLRNVILNSDDCNPVDNFSGLGDRTWIALRTPTPVNDRGRVLKRSIVEIAIKLDANATAPGSALIAFITGGWKDMDDGIPEDGETSCTGGVFPILQVLDP